MITLDATVVSDDLSSLLIVHRVPAAGTRDRIDPLLQHDGERPFRLTLASVTASPAPLIANTLERHPFSTQTFLPINVSRWLALVAPSLPDGRPDLAHARAVVLGPDQAVTYRKASWHLGLTALDCAAAFAVIMWRDDGADNDEFFQLKEAIHVRF